jgi:hypothetical protein
LHSECPDAESHSAPLALNSLTADGTDGYGSSAAPPLALLAEHEYPCPSAPIRGHSPFRAPRLAVILSLPKDLTADNADGYGSSAAPPLALLAEHEYPCPSAPIRGHSPFRAPRLAVILSLPKDLTADGTDGYGFSGAMPSCMGGNQHVRIDRCLEVDTGLPTRQTGPLQRHLRHNHWHPRRRCSGPHRR